MRQHRTLGGGNEPRVEPDIHLRDDPPDRLRRGAQQPQDLPLALLAMADHAAHQPLGIVDRIAVTRIIDTVVARLQFLQAAHIIAHVAIVR